MTYSSEVIADSPYLYWRLGHPSGTTAADASGNGRTGYCDATPGATGLLTGDSDTAVSNDGTANKIGTRADTTDLTAFSIEAWVNQSSTNSGTRFVAGREDSGVTGIFRLTLVNRVPTIEAWSSAGATPSVAGTALTAGTTHHLVGTYDGTTLRLYVDGSSVGTPSTAASGALRTVNTDFTILAQPSGNMRYGGTLDEVAYYTTALSSTRVGVHYTAGTSGGPAPEEGTGAGTWTWSGAATGKRAPKATGTGVWAWVGVAVGDSPADGSGTAAGTWTWAGAAVGEGDSPTTGTDVTNRFDGIAIGGRATVDWEPPVEEPPTPPAQAQVSAQSHTATVNPVTGEVTLDATIASKDSPRTRIVVGNRDVTYWRGIPTPEPDYTLAKPLGYGPATITLPQAKVPLEVPGEGNLLFCGKGKQVRVQRVGVGGAIIATDWIGFIVAHDMDGGTLTLECAGHAQGRAALVELQPPIFPGPLLDIGRHMYEVLNQGLGVNMTPFHGPHTGMVSRKLPGMGALEAVSTLCAMAQSFDGTQWSVHPIHGTTTYRMAAVDTDTIAGTVWLDDAHTPGRLRSDMAEEPNRVYARGITPDGLRVRFGVYPNLKQGEAAPYPMAGGASFGPGTVDADTLTGDGISVMNNRLSATGYRPPDASNAGPAGATFTADDSESVENLQEDADLAQSGNMNQNTWAALWDLEVTGRGLDRSRVLPAAQTSATHVWRRSATGAPIAKNPLYDKRVMKVDRTVDIEGVFHRRQIKRFARRVLVTGSTTNWLGTITFNLGGLVEGDHDGPVTSGVVMNARALRPGMNLKLANLDNTVVHISALQYSGGIVTATVDTRARDAVEVWEVIRRNRESRRNPARAWLREHRGRQVTPRTFDEVGGMLGNKISLDADRWTVFPVVAGLQGTVNLLRVETTNAPAMFCIAIFGRRIGRKKLAHMIGNPLAEGNGRWKNEHVREKLDADNVLVYAAGDFEQPCGYWPHNPTDGDDDGEAWDTLPNGKWQDDASFGYRTNADAPVLWVAIYPDRNTHIKAGRIMWPQLEEGA